MTHKKRPSTEKMYDYKKEKVEFARELGVNGANNTEVNAKMAAEEINDISNKEFKRRYGNRAFSWRGKNIIKRNINIVSEKPNE